MARDLLGGPPPGEIPARVRAAIRRQERGSEILIKIIQLGVVGVFGIFWLVSPRTDAETSFTLVPYALAIYFALTLFGLAWAIRRELPDWAVYVSILFDIGLLMALIWSFHIQYRQPPSFYLKVPTFLYIFIFVALRVLRFQPRFVLAAGLIAAAAWIAMLGYVVATDRSADMVTRNFVHYLTSNSVLIGAEVDKILTVLVVTGILWLALRRGRALLVRAVVDRAAAENLSRFFDEPVASRIRGAADTEALARGVERRAAILVIDLRGFTRLAAKLPPQRVLAVLSDYQRRVVPIIRARGGTIDKFLGDGILASFGAARDSPNAAADALATVDAVVAEAATWRGSSGPLNHLGERPLGTAVAEGPVVFGTVGDGERLEFTVVGSAVNLAAKLEKHNKALGTRALATAEAYRAALRQGYRPERAVKIVTSRIEAGDEPLALAVLHP